MEALPLESVLLILRDRLHAQEGQRPSEILFNTSIRDVKRELFQQFASVSRSQMFNALVPIPEYAHVKGGAALEIMGIIPYFSSPDVDVQVLAPEDGEALMNKIAAALPRIDGFPGFGFEGAALTPTEPIADEIDFRKVEHYRVSHIRSKDYEKVTVSVKLGEFQDTIFDFALPSAAAAAAAQLPAPHTISPFPLPILVEQNLQSLINRYGFVYGSDMTDPVTGRTRHLYGYEEKYENLLIDWVSNPSQTAIEAGLEREKHLRQKVGLNFTKLKNHMERLMLLFESASPTDAQYLVDLFRRYLMVLELQSIQLPAHHFLETYLPRLLSISARYGLSAEAQGVMESFELNLETWNRQRTPYKGLFTSSKIEEVLGVIKGIQESPAVEEPPPTLPVQEVSRSASPTESQEDEELVKELELIAKLQEDEAWQVPKTTAPGRREQERQEEIKYFKTSPLNRRKAIEEAEKEKKKKEKEEREARRLKKEESQRKKREEEKLKAAEERALLKEAAEGRDVKLAYYLCIEPAVVDDTYLDDMMSVLTATYTSAENPKPPQGNIFYTIRPFDMPDLPYIRRETIQVYHEHPAFMVVLDMVRSLFRQVTDPKMLIFERLQKSYLRMIIDITALLITALPEKRARIIEISEEAKEYMPESGQSIILEKVHRGFWSIYMSLIDIALQSILEETSQYADPSDEPVRYSKLELLKIIRPLLDNVKKVKGPLQIQLNMTQEELHLVNANLFQLFMNVRNTVTIRTMKHLSENSKLGAEASGGQDIPTVYFIPTPSAFSPQVLMVYLRQLQDAGLYYIREPLHFTKLFYAKYPALEDVFERLMVMIPGLEYMVLEIMMWKSLPIWMEPKNDTILSIFTQFLLRIFTGSTGKIGVVLCINSEEAWQIIEQVLLTYSDKKDAITFANTYMDEMLPKIKQRIKDKQKLEIDFQIFQRKAIQEGLQEGLRTAPGAAAAATATATATASSKAAEAPEDGNSFATIHAGHTPKTPGKGKGQKDKGKKTRGGGKKGVKVDARRATQKKKSKPQ